MHILKYVKSKKPAKRTMNYIKLLSKVNVFFLNNKTKCDLWNKNNIYQSCIPIKCQQIL